MSQTIRTLVALCFCCFLSVSVAEAAASKTGNGGGNGKTSAQRVYTLEEAVKRALEANPGLEAKLRTMEQARMQVGVAQSYFWPTVNYVFQHNRLENTGGIGNSDDMSNTTETNGLRVALSLFNGFAHLNNLEQSRLNVDVEGARHLQTRHQLIANVQLQFLLLLKLREDMKTVVDSRKRIETQLAAAKAFVRLEMAPMLYVLQNEVELARIEQQRIRVANDIRNGEVQLNNYLGFKPTEDIKYSGNLRDYGNVQEITEEDALNRAIRERPDAIIALKSIAVAEKTSLVTAAKYLPTVSLNFDSTFMNRSYEDTRQAKDYTRQYQSVGLSFNWNLFDGGGTTFSLLSDRKRVASLRKEYENTMSNIRTEVIRAYIDIVAARELVLASRKGVEAARESYNMSYTRYNTHIGTITDLLDTQSKLTQAEADSSQAMCDFQSARSRFFYNIAMERLGLQ